MISAPIKDPHFNILADEFDDVVRKEVSYARGVVETGLVEFLAGIARSVQGVVQHGYELLV